MMKHQVFLFEVAAVSRLHIIFLETVYSDKCVSLSNGNGGSKSKSVKRRTHEQATKVSPEENSFFPTSMTTLLGLVLELCGW